jgi:hypothetical protein
VAWPRARSDPRFTESILTDKKLTYGPGTTQGPAAWPGPAGGRNVPWGQVHDVVVGPAPQPKAPRTMNPSTAVAGVVQPESGACFTGSSLGCTGARSSVRAPKRGLAVGETCSTEPAVPHDPAVIPHRPRPRPGPPDPDAAAAHRWCRLAHGRTGYAARPYRDGGSPPRAMS